MMREESPLNDVSTMNKTMEYMAYGLPAVAFDLVETRVSGGECLLYVPSGDIAAVRTAPSCSPYSVARVVPGNQPSA